MKQREPEDLRSDGVGDERALVAAFLRHGDERAFRAIYRRHAPSLYRLATRLLTGNERDAEDAIQTVWIRAAESLGGFRWDSSLGTWLTGITLNACREIGRRRRRDHVPGGDDVVSSNGAGRATEGRRIDLERAIQRLPRGYREVLVLHDVEGYTHAEIGRLLGIEAGTSKSQLSRARRSVRNWLEGRPEGTREGSSRIGVEQGTLETPSRRASER